MMSWKEESHTQPPTARGEGRDQRRPRRAHRAEAVSLWRRAGYHSAPALQSGSSICTLLTEGTGMCSYTPITTQANNRQPTVWRRGGGGSKCAFITRVGLFLWAELLNSWVNHCWVTGSQILFILHINLTDGVKINFRRPVDVDQRQTLILFVSCWLFGLTPLCCCDTWSIQ